MTLLEAAKHMLNGIDNWVGSFPTVRDKITCDLRDAINREEWLLANSPSSKEPLPDPWRPGDEAWINTPQGIEKWIVKQINLIAIAPPLPQTQYAYVQPCDIHRTSEELVERNKMKISNNNRFKEIVEKLAAMELLPSSDDWHLMFEEVYKLRTEARELLENNNG